MSAVVPSPEALSALSEAPDTGPLVMINLLKFKPGGAESYAKYARAVLKIIEAMGGKVIYSGPVECTVIGDRTWDAVAIVQYPSRKAFLRMIADPEYQRHHVHREEGLEATELYATHSGTVA
jgi:uncharacterized protein (DUF1330 family)